MDWKELYRQKLTTADEAVKRIKSGDRVVVTHATGESTLLSDAMVRNASAYRDVEIVHMVAMGKAEYCQPEYAGNFRHNSLFLGGTTRKAIAEGRGDFTPVFFSEIPDLFRTRLHPNVVLLQLSPPDEHGYCSYGISVDYTKPAAECADLVIAQINRNMPRTLGDSFIHVKDIDCIIEADTPVIELAPPKITDVERAIGENVASLVRDGDCLQLGIGAIPDAVLLFLKEKNDLGIHSEMFSDGVVELVEAGVITNKCKNIHRGRSVATFLMGTRSGMISYGVSGCSSRPGFASSMICSSSSSRGLSDVRMTKSERRATISAIFLRLVRSRLPAQPKRVTTRPTANFCIVVMIFSSPSGLWA